MIPFFVLMQLLPNIDMGCGASVSTLAAAGNSPLIRLRPRSRSSDVAAGTTAAKANEPASITGEIRAGAVVHREEGECVCNCPSDPDPDLDVILSHRLIMQTCWML